MAATSHQINKLTRKYLGLSILFYLEVRRYDIAVAGAHTLHKIAVRKTQCAVFKCVLAARATYSRVVWLCLCKKLTRRLIRRNQVSGERQSAMSETATRTKSSQNLFSRSQRRRKVFQIIQHNRRCIQWETCIHS